LGHQLEVEVSNKIMRKLMKQFWNLGTPLEEHVNMNRRCPNIPWLVRLTIAQQKA